jgi:1-acyl-sn-glycerol-3-phosphate acyltransferase
LLIVSNHQSHLDPVLIGVSCDRQLSSVARDTLFRFRPLGMLISSYDAIPIDREGTALAGLKETLRRLKLGDAVLVFPEGTRTRDGQLGPLKSGFCALVRRTGVPLQPVAIAGAFEAWPRRRSWPGPATIHIEYARPLAREEIAALTDEQLLAEVRDRISDCQQRADAARRRSVRELPALPAVS